MDSQNDKCVMVIDENLPLGIIANTAAVLGITLGRQHPEIVGADVSDGTKNEHLGITAFPVPILKGNVQIIKDLRSRLYTEEFKQLTVADFSDVAQSCNDYKDFTKKLSKVDEEKLQYFGIAICGNKKLVNKLTGSMGLLR